MPLFPQYRRNLLETKNDLLLDETNQQPSYARYIDYTQGVNRGDTTIGGKRMRGEAGKASDLVHGDASATFDKDGKLKTAQGSAGLGTKQLGAYAGGSYNNKTGDLAVDVGVNAAFAGMNLGVDTETKSVNVGAQIDTKLFGLEGSIGGSKEYGLVTKVGGNIMTLKGNRETFAKGPFANTSRDRITLKGGPEGVIQVTMQIDRVLTAKSHPLHKSGEITVLQSENRTELTASGKTHYKEVEVSTLLDNGKYRNVTAEKMSSPEFDRSLHNVNNLVDVIGIGSKIQSSYRDQIVDNLKGRLKGDPNKPSEMPLIC